MEMEIFIWTIFMFFIIDINLIGRATVQGGTTSTTSTSTTTTAKSLDSCYSFTMTGKFYDAVLNCTQKRTFLLSFNMSETADNDSFSLLYESKKQFFKFIPGASLWLVITDTNESWMYSFLALAGNYSDTRRYALANATKMYTDVDFKLLGGITASNQQRIFGCYTCKSLPPPLSNRHPSQLLYHNGSYYWVSLGSRSMIESDIDCGKNGGVLAPIGDRSTHAFAAGIQSSLAIDGMWIGLQKHYQDTWLNSNGESSEYDDSASVINADQITKPCAIMSSNDNYLFRSVDCATSASAALCMDTSDDCKLQGSIRRLGYCYRNASRDRLCSTPINCDNGSQFMSTAAKDDYIFDFLKVWSLDTQPSSLLDALTSSVVCGCDIQPL